MHNSTRPAIPWLRAATVFVLLTTVFAIAYTQSPLYTSNQNQYFLHGAAQAGTGFLNQDWLANTRDPTPVFSELTYLTYRLLRLEALFYIFYALLMGIYLFSLLGIVSMVVDIRNSRVRLLVYLALLIVIHSAAWRFAISKIIGANWTYILEDGVAVQRLLGPVFEPSTFGVFLLLSIYLFLRQKPYLGVISATLAATFHPTYLLSAAALTAGYMWVAFWENRHEEPLFRAVRAPLLLGLVALVTVAPILFYVYSAFGSTSAAALTRAQAILVNFRIPHHAVVSQWFDATTVVKILFVVAALYLARKTRLFAILLVCVLAATSLTIFQLVSKSNALALVFPWRISTFIVPLAIAIVLGRLVVFLAQRFPNLVTRYEKVLVALSLAAIALAVLAGSIRFVLDLQRKANSEERPMESYIAAHHRSGEVYLTPVSLQDFRLASGSPAYIDFKSIPYRDSDVLEWLRRNRLAARFYNNRDCSILQQLASQEGVTHVVLGSEQFDLQCPQMQPVYRDAYYAVYALQSASP
jgi:hypothetical protein